MMSVTVSVRLTANDVISTFSGILDYEWGSRGREFESRHSDQCPQTAINKGLRTIFLSKITHFIILF